MKAELLILFMFAYKCVDIPTLAADAYRFEEARAKELSDSAAATLKSPQIRANLNRFNDQKMLIQGKHSLYVESEIEEAKLERQAMIDLDISFTFSKQIVEKKAKLSEIFVSLVFFKSSAEILLKIGEAVDKDLNFDIDKQMSTINSSYTKFMRNFDNFAEVIDEISTEFLILTKVQAEKNELEVQKDCLESTLHYMHESGDEDDLEEIKAEFSEITTKFEVKATELIRSITTIENYKAKIDRLCTKIAQSNLNFLALILNSLDKIYRVFLKENFCPAKEMRESDIKKQESALLNLFRQNNLLIQLADRIDKIHMIISEEDAEDLRKSEIEALDVLDKIIRSTYGDDQIFTFGLEHLKYPLINAIEKHTDNKDAVQKAIKTIFAFYSVAIENLYFVWNFIVNIIAKSCRATINYTLSTKFAELRKFRYTTKIVVWNNVINIEKVPQIKEYWTKKREIEERGERMVPLMPIMIDRINWWPIIGILIFIVNCLFLFWRIRMRLEKQAEIKKNMDESFISL